MLESRGEMRWGLIHLVLGAFTLIVFLITGAYMRTHEPPMAALEPGRYLMYLSRHIYILSAALVHLVLGAYWRPARTKLGFRAQLLGSLLLITAAALLMAAFVFEPMAGRMRTPVSTLGLYGLFAGSLLHVAAAWRGPGSGPAHGP